MPFEAVRASFADPDMVYAPFIFWFWDEPLDPAKMAQMSRTLAAEGFSPGYAHARRSMVGTADLPDAERLGDKWFASFDAALKEAEARRNYLGYCDEYWWPSFQANGRVLAANPDLRAASLKWDRMEVPGGSDASVPSSFFATAAEVDPASGLILSKTLRTIGQGAAFSCRQIRAGCDAEILLTIAPIAQEKLMIEKCATQHSISVEEAAAIRKAFLEAVEKLAGQEPVKFIHLRKLWNEYLAAQPHDAMWFMRDVTHANVYGAQVVARMLEKYFAPAPESKPGTPALKDHEARATAAALRK